MKRFLLFLSFVLVFSACQRDRQTPRSTSGVNKVSVKVPTNEQGRTIEQENISNRLLLDNTPGSIKHLYVMSAMTGDVLIYSTVKGKVTSSGKRLTPNTVAAGYNGGSFGIAVDIGGDSNVTGEVLQDDGTYGNSSEYLFWWDIQGRFHQHYPGAGQIIHISDQPLPVKNVKIRLDLEGQHAAPSQAADPEK